MSGRENQRDMDEAEDLVRQYPGYPMSWLSWILMGGQCSEYGPIPFEGMIHPERWTKSCGFNKRLSDLIKRGRIWRGPARDSLVTDLEGYYPITMKRWQERSVVADPKVKEAQRAHNAKALANLKSMLKE